MNYEVNGPEEIHGAEDIHGFEEVHGVGSWNRFLAMSRSRGAQNGQMQVSNSFTPDRALWALAKSKFPNTKPMPGYLRSEIVLLNNSTSYVFRFSNDQLSLPSRGLNREDAFMADSLGLFLCIENKNKPGSGVLTTYPNSIQAALSNPVSGTAKVLIEDLEAVYNGNLKITINQEVIADGIDTRRFRKVQHTQESVTNEYDSLEPRDGYSQLTPTVIFSGKNKSEIALSLPSFLSAMSIQSLNTTYDVKVVAILKGLHIPGGAK